MIDLDEFVRLHERALLNFALQLTRDEDDAHDLLQDTWLKCITFQQLLSGLSEQKQRSWLFTVLKNRWLDICRHRKLERLSVPMREPAMPSALVQYQLEAQLEKLPSLERELVYQKYWLGCNSRQIAEDKGIPEGTVRWRLKLGLDKLRTLIEQSDKEERCLL
ncbi:MAG: RNA polymerase sigma factor [Candidatus Cloacimonetes bacterium]|nr:RNA polymerase sigma factor [Candidatus Cloacimonadota bacterium]